MHTHSLARWQHSHAFLGSRHRHRENRTWLVVGLTAAMMTAEIVGGALYGSMALFADGWHMATHAAALLISAGAYAFARAYANDARFAFGTGKVGDLAGFTSAIVLLIVAFSIAVQSGMRLLDPVPIAITEAMTIALLGLAVNVLSAWLLADDHHHHHADDGHDLVGHHEHEHPDGNLRAAYMHVVADALTSVLAIVALGAAYMFAWRWIDPVIGLVGATVVGWWAVGLLRGTSATLLDASADGPRGVSDPARTGDRRRPRGRPARVARRARSSGSHRVDRDP